MRSLIKLSFTLVLTLVLAGCAAVGPDYKKPEFDAPDAWKTVVINEVSSASSPLESWWESFNDPVLDSLIIRAKQANFNLRTAVLRIVEAQAFLRISTGDRYPQLGADGGFQRSKTPESLVGPSFLNNPSSVWSAGLSTSWEIDVFGRVRRSIEASEADLDASIEDYRDVMVTLYAQVASLYVELRTTQQRLEYANENINNQKETLKIAQARYDAGLVSEADVAQAKYNLANTETLVPQLIPSLENALNQLAILLGQAPGTLDKELLEGFGIPSPDMNIAIAPPAELLRRRPDIRQAERTVAAQTARIGVATADLYPEFSLGGALTLQASELGNLFESNSLGWSLAPGVRWNLFSGGKIEGNIQVQQSKTDQAINNYHATVLNALAEVETTMVRMRQDQLLTQKLAEAVAASQHSVDLTSISYVAGLVTFQGLLDSQRSLFSQQDELAKSQGQQVVDFIDLNRALGGGWSLSDPIPVKNDTQSKENK